MTLRAFSTFFMTDPHLTAFSSVAYDFILAMRKDII